MMGEGEPVSYTHLNMSAKDYFSYKKQLVPHILEAYHTLVAQMCIRDRPCPMQVKVLLLRVYAVYSNRTDTV